jgi:hypothetical protein
VRVALATCTALPEGHEDDRLLLAPLAERGAEARFEAWDDPAVDWEGYDRVVVRSTWDYTSRREEFVGWAVRAGERIRNRPEVIRWNSDKAYLAELAGDGIAVVPTRFVRPGDPLPELAGEVVVKPAISAGARDTGRFGPGAHAQARELMARLQGAGRTAMVQPYLERVDAAGETAIVFISGRASHVLRKQAVLRPDEEAPVREEDGLGAALAMWDEELVAAGEASADERELAAAVIAALERRFGEAPLYARVDMLRGEGGIPHLVELEAVEPSLYLATAPGAAERLAAAILAGD